jgi:hypothetical protein
MAAPTNCAPSPVIKVTMCDFLATMLPPLGIDHTQARSIQRIPTPLCRG